MSRKGKLKSRLFSLPKDFTWDELVTLMSYYGFSLIKGAGSGRKFVDSQSRLLICHEPHPSNIVKNYVLKNAKALIEELSQEEEQDTLDLEGDE